MKQILTIILSFTTLFLSYGINAQELTLPKGDFGAMRKVGFAKVSEVINPLSVKLDDDRVIHLAGLDYPDLDYYEPGDLAVTAQEILNDFLKNQKVIIYQTESPKQGRMNRMGHHIAHLVRARDQVWVQGLLLSLGVTRVRTTKYNPEMGAQMLILENNARQEKSGLWANDKYAVLSPKQAGKNIGSYQIIEGKVVSVSMRKNKLYLNFGHNWKEDFTVGISSSDLRKFKKHNLAPRRWSDKRIRVRGWIESYNGPFIDIDHPERIETLFDISGNTGTLPGTGLPDRPASSSKKPSPPTKDSGSALPKLND